MKLTQKFFLLLLLSANLMLSCKKKSDPVTPAVALTKTCLLTKATDDSLTAVPTYDSNNVLVSSKTSFTGAASNMGFTLNYSYDANGRLGQIQCIPDNATSGVENTVTKFQYDSQGRIVLEIQSATSPAIDSDSTVYVFVNSTKVNKTLYSKNNISGTFSYDTLSTVLQLDADGDLVTEFFSPFLSSTYDGTTFSFSRDTLIKLNEYQYDTQLINPYKDLLFFSGPYFKSKKILKQYYYHDTHPSVSGNQITEQTYWITKYTYNYDSDGNLIAANENINIYDSSGSSILLLNTGQNYFYTCK